MTVTPMVLDVSRETLDRLTQFATLLEKWNARINLVAPSTIPDIWNRHIVDSAQLYQHAPDHATHWVDLGSGGGLPGLVCAILAAGSRPDCSFTLIESDSRKAAFLSTTARELGLDTRILTTRAEAAPPQDADIVTARALAPLPRLLPLVARHLAKNGVAILPKGKNHAAELAAARGEWQFDATVIRSQTDVLARLIILKELARV